MDIEWVIYHLIHNDDEGFTSIADLDIDLCRSDLDQWDRLLVGLSRNRTVTSVRLSRGYQRRVATRDDLQCLCGALRNLPNLATIELDSFTILDLAQTETLFRDHETIQDVWIENAQCHSDEDDEDEEDDDFTNNNNHTRFECFLGFLASMTRRSLRSLRIEVPESVSRRANLARFLDATSKLESLVIETTSGTSSRRQTCHQETNPPSAVSETMSTLRYNTVLTKLDVDFPLSFSEFKETAIMLKHNTTLIDLRLRIDSSRVLIVGDDSNTTTASNHQEGHRGGHYNPLFLESIELFLDSLTTNQSSALERFLQYNHDDPLFHGGKHNRMAATNRLIETSLDMLRYNLSLTTFSFFLFNHQDTKVVTQTKQMFLRLNRRGRRSVQHKDFRETLPKCSWIDQISKHTQDDLDGVYYYISTNPSICSTTIEESDVATCWNSKSTRAATILDCNTNNTHSNSERENVGAANGRLETTTTRDPLSSHRFDSCAAKICPLTKRRRVETNHNNDDGSWEQANDPL